MEKLGWNKSSLGELGKITSSKRIFKSEYVKEGVPFYRTKEVKNLANGNDIATELFIKKERFDEIVDRFGSPKEGDILLTAIGTIGEIYVVKGNDPFYFKDGNVLWLKDFDSLDKHFLRYALMAFVDELRLLSRGAAYNALPINKLKNYEVFVPPIPEQKRIVAILDQAFADIEQARAKTEQNLKNARELFESYIQQVFSQRGEGWVDEKMSDVCEGKITDGTHQTPKYFDEGYIFLSSKNVTSGVIDWDNIKYLDETQHIEMQKRLTPRLNDILLAKNGTTGVAAIVDRDVIFNIYVSLALLRPSEKILPRYLLHFVNSPVAKAQFNKRLKGIGVPNLHLKEIRDVMVSLPVSIDQQSIIVSQIDSLLLERDRLVNIYLKKLESIGELKKSILQKAFSGELTKDKEGAAA